MIPGATVDTILPGKAAGQMVAQGSVAQRLLASRFNINGLRTLDTLRKEEWKQFDDVVIDVARKRLVAVGDLMSAGLTQGINNPLGTTILEWEQASDFTAANVSMDGVTPGEEDRMEFTLQSLPLPIIHKEFRINIRALSASRERGQPLDTTQAALATRLVVEKIEEMLFLGSTVVVGGAGIEGYTTATNRNTGSQSAAWDTAATGEQMLDDIIAMIAALQGDNYYGPYGVYTTLAAYNRMLDDFKTNSDKSILSRLLETPDVSFIRPTKDVVADTTLMVNLSSDVVDIVDAMQPTMVQWESNGGMTQHFKVMAIMIPRMKSDAENQSGIAHYT